MKRRRLSDARPVSTLGVRYFDSVTDGYGRVGQREYSIALFFRLPVMMRDETAGRGVCLSFIHHHFQLDGSVMLLHTSVGGGAKWNALHFNGGWCRFMERLRVWGYHHHHHHQNKSCEFRAEKQPSRLVLLHFFFKCSAFQGFTGFFLGFFWTNYLFTNNGGKVNWVDEGETKEGATVFIDWFAEHDRKHIVLLLFSSQVYWSGREHCLVSSSLNTELLYFSDSIKLLIKLIIVKKERLGWIFTNGFILIARPALRIEYLDEGWLKILPSPSGVLQHVPPPVIFYLLTHACCGASRHRPISIAAGGIWIIRSVFSRSKI